MAVIQEQIKEIEDALATLIRKAEALSPEGRGIVPQKAIRSFANGCRDLQGWHLGELKNAFEMGDNMKLTQAPKAVE